MHTFSVLYGRFSSKKYTWYVVSYRTTLANSTRNPLASERATMPGSRIGKAFPHNSSSRAKSCHNSPCLPAQTPEEQMDTIWLSPHGSENDTTCGATKELACSLSAATNILARWSAERREPNTHLIFTSGEYALTRQFYTGDETRQLIVETHPDEPTPAVVTRADVEDSATISFASTYMTLRRIIFAHSIIHSTGALVHLRASESIAVEDCHFRNNTSYSPPFSAAVSITGTSNTTFINCTWSDNLILGPTPSSREPNPPGGAALSWIHDSYPDQASSKHVYVLFKNCSFISTFPGFPVSLIETTLSLLTRFPQTMESRARRLPQEREEEPYILVQRMLSLGTQLASSMCILTAPALRTTRSPQQLLNERFLRVLRHFLEAALSQSAQMFPPV